MWSWSTTSPKLAPVHKPPTPPDDGVQFLFGANVRRVRTEKHMTQERLAEAAGLHPNYISSVERGERNISIRNIERLARALNVPMAYLVTEEPYS